jgi:SAM-dependent methyltransferase
MTQTHTKSLRILKAAAKRLIPEVLMNARRDYLRAKLSGKFHGLSAGDTFTAIYKDAHWGRSERLDDCFCSGTGSHQAHIVAPYVAAVGRFLKSFEGKPSVVDLGCGDFHVGSQIRAYCGTYIACDVVAQLIERNKVKFRELNVDFRILDMTADDPPEADVVMVRQVLQHLSNDLIAAAVGRFARKFRYLLVTEHLPSGDFIANVDKRTGPDTRLPKASGVVLTSTPFNLKVGRTEILCEVPAEDGVIRTHLYEL